MFAVETLPPQYYEERSAAEAAKRLAERQAAGATQLQAKAPVATQQSSPSQLSQALLQPPPLSRPGSSTVLGNIFQSFIKRTPSSPLITPVQTPLRTNTPEMGSIEEHTRREAAELIAKLKKEDEARRDTDICALPGWR